jgi:hypothetical protein
MAAGGRLYSLRGVGGQRSGLEAISQTPADGRASRGRGRYGASRWATGTER